MWARRERDGKETLGQRGLKKQAGKKHSVATKFTHNVAQICMEEV